jgi:outer membrane protein
MSHRCAISGLAILSATALQGPPAAGQTRNQDLRIYAGEMFGDRLTEAPLTGSNPILDDDATFGARYTYYFTNQWGLQLSVGYASSRATQVVTGDGNLGLTALGMEVLWNITPGFTFDGHKLMPYTEVGVGYA